MRTLQTHAVPPGPRPAAWTGRIAVSCAALAVLAWSGCSGSSSPATAPPEASARLVLNGAPDDWPAFKSWAVRKLQETPPAAPLPENPALATPRWPVIRLSAADVFGAAVRESAWKAEEVEAHPLAEVGPFRSGEPSANFAVSRTPNTAPGEDAAQLIVRVGGFRVRTEEVGMIVLEARFPFGRHVTLKWSRGGELVLPLPSNSAVEVFPIKTDGFSDWSGVLDSLQLLTDGVGQGPIEIEKITFLPRTKAFPQPTGVGRIRFDNTLRDALYAHAPGALTFPQITLPERARLQVELGVVGKNTAGDSMVDFRVEITAAGATREFKLESLEPGAGWTPVQLDLAEFGGQTVALKLVAQASSGDPVAVWGVPTIYQPVENPPLVVVYLIDTLAGEHMDLHGYARTTMPNLTRLAQRGVWFPQMVANAPRTVESVPNLMLGLTTERHGVHHNLTPAPNELVTLAEALQAAGFATASFVTNVYAGPRANMDQGFDTFVDKIGFFWSAREEADRTVPLAQTAAFLDANRDRPIFIYVHTAEPHAPYTPPVGFAGKFDPDYRGRVDGTYDPQRGFQRNTRTPRDLEHVVALYDEEILYADARVQAFLDSLAERGLSERLNFILTADHGEEFQQHGRWEHGHNIHNEQTRVPLVLAGPLFGTFGAVDVPAQTIDIAPTLLELLDVPLPYPLAGASLAPVVRAAAPPAERTAAVERLASRRLYISNHFWRKSNVIEYALVGNRWKLIASAYPVPGGPGGLPSPGFLLYDLQQDPRERNNLLEQQPEVARRLLEDLIVWRHSQPPYDVEVRGVVVADDIRALQQMGYVGGGEP